jgi:hypothetical protein
MDITDNQLNTLNNKIKSIQTKNVNDDNILLTKQLNEITASINIIKSSIIEVETHFNCIKNCIKNNIKINHNTICIPNKNKNNKNNNNKNNKNTSITKSDTSDKDNDESTLKLKKRPINKIFVNKNIVKLDGAYVELLSLESDEIEIKVLNCKLNTYLTDNKLIKDKYVILNKSLKKLLKTRKQKIYIDDILNYIKYEVK